MKTIIKTVLYVQMAAMLLTSVLAGHAADKKLVPFKGTLQAHETYDLEFPILSVNSSGVGNATHLGHFTVTHAFDVDLLTFIALGAAQFTAADGSTILTDTRALGDASGPIPTENPDVILIIELHTITGGTGRFAGATGSFIVERLLNQVTSITSGSFDGTIAFGKAK